MFKKKIVDGFFLYVEYVQTNLILKCIVIGLPKNLKLWKTWNLTI